MEFFNFGLEVEQKLDQHFLVEFHSISDSDGNGFNARRSKIDLQIGPN